MQIPSIPLIPNEGRGDAGGLPGYTPIQSDCTLYYAFWDGTAHDHSGNGQNGNVTLGAGSFGPTGLTFDGLATTVTFTNTAAMYPGTGDFAFMFWASPLPTSPVGSAYVLDLGIYLTNWRSIVQFHWATAPTPSSCIHDIYDPSGNNFYHGGLYDRADSGGPGTFAGWHLFGLEIHRGDGLHGFCDTVDYTVDGGPDTASSISYGLRANNTISVATVMFLGTIGEMYMFNGTFGTYSGMTRGQLYNFTKARYGL